MNLMERKVSFSSFYNGFVDLNNPVLRYPENPIISPEYVNKVWTDPDLQVVTVHNAGIAIYTNYVIMLFRSHLRSGKSVLGLAKSQNGLNDWQISSKPVITPATINDTFAPGVNIDKQIEMEAGGVEDPRITQIGNEYAITYSAYDATVKNQVRVCMITTSDFSTFVRWGPMLNRDMRNVVLFSKPVSKGYAALFRPNDSTIGDIGGIYTQIRIGYANDWRCGPWEIEDTPFFTTGGGPSAFSDKIGPGAPPIETSNGWLSLFHGVRTTMAGNPYVLGVAFHDTKELSSVSVSKIPILFPTASDCRVSDFSYVHVPQVVFTCGALRQNDGTIVIYYGGNDTVMNVGLTHEDILIELCKQYNLTTKK